MKALLHRERAVFLTGATGVLGSRLVPILYQQHRKPMFLLIRAHDKSQLKERFDALFRFWGRFPEYDIHFLNMLRENCVPLIGDLAEERCGLSHEDYRLVSRHTSHIVHCAGNVRLNMTIEEARRSSLIPAKNLVELWDRSAEAQGDKGIKFDYVSTVGVAGKKTGLIKEEWQDDAAGYHNTYEQAKAETESYLRDVFLEKAIPYTIHRPSMIVGDSVTGNLIRFQVFYYICDFLSGRYTKGILPNSPDFKLDIIPVDIASKAISNSLFNPAATRQIFHLSGGPRYSYSMKDLAEQVSGLYHEMGLLCVRRAHFIPTSIFNLCVGVFTMLSGKKIQKRLSTLPYFLTYLRDVQFFDNSNALSCVLPEDALERFHKKGESIRFLLMPYLKEMTK